MNVDILIAGAGIAGMTMALTLHQRGVKIAVADKFRPRVASRVAAGLINPIPGRRFAPTWNVDEVLDEAVAYWGDCCYLLGKEVFTVLPILRFFHDEDAEFWLARRHTANRFVEREFSDEEQFNGLRNDQGGVVITGGRADIPAFLAAATRYLQERGVSFINDSVLVEECSAGGRMEWQGVSAGAIIWCEGWRSAINPLWSYLPFVPAKGETLTIHAPELTLPGVAVRGAFIAPAGEQLFRVGATYVWNFADEEPTVEGREELVHYLDNWIETPYSIVAHDAGVRPAMRDIKPVIGRHRNNPNHWILNGLGAKGALLAPYCARQLAEMVMTGNACNPAVDAVRF